MFIPTCSYKKHPKKKNVSEHKNIPPKEKNNSESSEKLTSSTSSSSGDSSPVNSSLVSPVPTTASKLQAQAANIDAVTDRLNRLTCLVGKLKNEIDHRQVS